MRAFTDELDKTFEEEAEETPCLSHPSGGAEGVIENLVISSTTEAGRNWDSIEHEERTSTDLSSSILVKVALFANSMPVIEKGA